MWLTPDLAQLVVNAYQKARAYALANPVKTAATLATVAGIEPAIATAVITDRTKFDISPVPGAKELAVLRFIGPIFVSSGDVASQGLIDAALMSLY